MEAITRLMQSVQDEELPAIRQAAESTADAILQGGKLHVFGTGHSHMLAEELFYRAGGLACINPILEESLMLHRNASLSTAMERLSGLSALLLAQQPAKPGDAILIASNSGRNAVVVEMALEAKAIGMTVIALTSLKQAASSASRHASGLRLHEISDIVIDNHGCIGDAAVRIDGLPESAAPTSTVIGAFIVNLLAAEAIELLLQRGFHPELFASSNSDGGDLRNERLIQKYKGEIRCL